MIDIEVDGVILHCEQAGGGSGVVRGYEGSASVLDLENQDIAEIDRKAFLSCKSLKKLVLPKSLTHLGDWAFSKCIHLEEVVFAGPFRSGIFGKSVFEGCEALKSLSFDEMQPDAQVLSACTVNRMSADYLLRSEDFGEESWFQKWDMALLSLLNTDDGEGSHKVALCGEEDISYDGVGMVDGEMPGETEDFIRNAGKNKSFLVFTRLQNSAFLKEDARNRYHAYLRERGFGSKQDSVWRMLKEDCAGNMEFWQAYLDIVHPDGAVMDKMIEDLSARHVQAKAFLIDAAGSGGDILDDLLL